MSPQQLGVESAVVTSDVAVQPVDSARAFIQQGFNFAAAPQRPSVGGNWPPEPTNLFRRSAESLNRSQAASPLASPRVRFRRGNLLRRRHPIETVYAIHIVTARSLWFRGHE